MEDKGEQFAKRLEDDESLLKSDILVIVTVNVIGMRKQRPGLVDPVAALQHLVLWPRGKEVPVIARVIVMQKPRKKLGDPAVALPDLVLSLQGMAKVLVLQARNLPPEAAALQDIAIEIKMPKTRQDLAAKAMPGR